MDVQTTFPTVDNNLVDYPLLIPESDISYTQNIVRGIFTNCYVHLRESDEIDIADSSTIASETRYYTEEEVKKGDLSQS